MKATRMLAALAGDRHYLTGKPCKHGHTSVRDTATGQCIECRNSTQKIDRKRYQAKIKELLTAKVGRPNGQS